MIQESAAAKIKGVGKEDAEKSSPHEYTKILARGGEAKADRLHFGGAIASFKEM